MKPTVSKRILSIIMCLCMLVLAGCAPDAPVDSDIERTTTSKESSTTESTATTTTTTTTTTKESTTESTSSQTSKESTSKQTTTTKTRNSREEDPNVEKLIALTFDDGPYSPVTNRILDTLEKHGAKATFFVVGNRVASYKSTVKRAHNLGCEIASHTWSHKNLTKLSVSEMNSEIKKSVDAITDVTGGNVTLVRPPEGGVNGTVQANIGYPLIMWSVDSMDWKHRNATKNYNTIVNHVFDGCIILMHDLYPATAETVEKLVPDLMAKGYKFVTVTELMEARGVSMQNGQKYSAARP